MVLEYYDIRSTIHVINMLKLKCNPFKISISGYNIEQAVPDRHAYQLRHFGSREQSRDHLGCIILVI